MGSIHTHVSNFIDTWEGWAKVLNGLSNFSFSSFYAGLKEIFTDSRAVLSSK